MPAFERHVLPDNQEAGTFVQTVGILAIQTEQAGIRRNYGLVEEIVLRVEGGSGIPRVIIHEALGCLVVHHVEGEHSPPHDDGVDAVRVGGSRNFNIDPVHALLADHRLGKTETVDTAVDTLEGLGHGFGTERAHVADGILLAFRRAVKVRLDDDAHTAGKVQTEFNRVSLGILDLQDMLPIPVFQQEKNFHLRGKTGNKRTRGPCFRSILFHYTVAFFCLGHQHVVLGCDRIGGIGFGRFLQLA